MKLIMITLGAVLAGGFWLTASPAGAEEAGRRPQMAEEVSSETVHPGYANLAELTGTLCRRAAEAFDGFFDPSLVQVPPFVHVSALANNSSMLGVMLADQVAAMLNGHANAAYGNGEGQRLEGVLQEVDGYLRIHVLGTNARSECRSHVISVEMSAPLYRALHTYAEARNGAMISIRRRTR